ncbi:MAG: hypothetical protein ACK4N5_11160, partial [Myxococcales bacterium]
HLRLVEARLVERSVAGVAFEAIAVPPRHRGGLRRLAADLPLHARLIGEARRRAADDLIFTSVTTTGLLALKTLLRPDGPPCTVVPHAILEKVVDTEASWFPWIAGARRDVPLRLLALSGSILPELRQRAPGVADGAVAVEHPYFFPEPVERAPFENGKVRFGSIGQAHRSKGLGALIRLARAVKGAPGGEWATFVHIGPVADPELAAQAEGLVELPAQQGFLERSEFERRIAELDYAVFCYPPDSYALNVSGAIFDAFAAGKPVLALRNRYFEHLFALTRGPRGEGFGELVAGEMELQALLKRIVSRPPIEEYVAQREAISRVRALFSPERVGAQLRGLFGDERAAP